MLTAVPPSPGNSFFPWLSAPERWEVNPHWPTGFPHLGSQFMAVLPLFLPKTWLVQDKPPATRSHRWGCPFAFPFLFHFPFCFPFPFFSPSQPSAPLTHHEAQIPGSLPLLYFFQSHVLPFPSREDFDHVPKLLPADRRTLLLLKEHVFVPLMPWGNGGRAALKHWEYCRAGVLLLPGMTLEALDSLQALLLSDSSRAVGEAQ